MRKTKANLKRQSSGRNEELPETENIETEREQRFEEVDGETSTDGLGPAYTTAPEFENSIATADGPLSGDATTPPMSESEVERAGLSKSEKKKLAKKKVIDRSAGSHIAARSPKKF